MMSVGEFGRSCSFVICKLCLLVNCILAQSRPWLWAVSVSLGEEVLALDTSSTQAGIKPSLFHWDTTGAFCRGPSVLCVLMQLVCAVLSAFRQRGVNIHRSPAELVLFVQCGQRKPKPSWSGLPELSELRADHIHCGRKCLILLMCSRTHVPQGTKDVCRTSLSDKLLFP